MQRGAPRVGEAVDRPDPPSFWKCGVTGGCQSIIITTRAPAASAWAISRLTWPTIAAPPVTGRLPLGSAKSFWTSTTIRAVASS
jgi:hypothetical protein